MRGITKERTYICDDDLEESDEERTTWKLGTLTLDDQRNIKNGLAYQESEDRRQQRLNGRRGRTRTKLALGDQEFLVLQKALLGCENFKDEDGESIPYPEGGFNPLQPKPFNAFLVKIPPSVRAELVSEILEGGSLTRRDRPSSGSRSGSPSPGLTETADRPNGDTAHAS